MAIRRGLPAKNKLRGFWLGFRRRLLTAETCIASCEGSTCYSSDFSGSVRRGRADRTNIRTKMRRASAGDLLRDDRPWANRQSQCMKEVEAMAKQQGLIVGPGLGPNP
jgi:hypothetical protein